VTPKPCLFFVFIFFFFSIIYAKTPERVCDSFNMNTQDKQSVQNEHSNAPSKCAPAETQRQPFFTAGVVAKSDSAADDAESGCSCEETQTHTDSDTVYKGDDINKDETRRLDTVDAGVGANVDMNVAIDADVVKTKACITGLSVDAGAGAGVRLAWHTVRPQSLDGVNNRIPVGVWLTGAPVLWRQGLTGAGVRVGVIDSGIDDSHPQLRGKVVLRRDYVNDGAARSQFYPHGTHVAGIIAANGPMLRGVAPSATLLDYRVIDRNGVGTLATFYRAVSDAVRDRCMVIHISIRTSVNYSMLRNAIRNAMHAGILVVAGAGDDGELSSPPQISYPAQYPEVFSVGAIDFNTNNGTVERVSLSNCAPNVDAVAGGWYVYSTAPNGQYAVMSGTATAAAHATGLAALLRQRAATIFADEPFSIPQGINRLHVMLKKCTVGVFGGPNQCSGAGLLTVYPVVPTRNEENMKWFIPGFSDGQPV